jgi:hypothetical protein
VELLMPAKSKKQQRFMAAVANNPKFAKQVGVPKNVGEKFMKMKKYKSGGFPDLTGDGKVTKADILKGRGVTKLNEGGVTNMKKQGYNARLDDSMGAKNGKKKQSMKSRRDESEGMEKSMGKRKFAGDKAMKFQAGGRMPVGMANPRAGVSGGAMPQPAPEPIMAETGSMPRRRVVEGRSFGKSPEELAARRARRSSGGRRSGRGRKAGGQIGAYKAGGKVRGSGCATKGVRAAKMVSMKGS